MIKVEQTRWRSGSSWQPCDPGSTALRAGLVFVFGGHASLGDSALMSRVVAAYHGACVIGCTTAGEIAGAEVTDESLVCTAMSFDAIRCRGHCHPLTRQVDSEEVGCVLAKALVEDDLRHVFVFSNGLDINGTGLVHGLTSSLPSHVSVTGGLAGDADRFRKTLVVWNGEAHPHAVAAVGLYGKHLRIGYGSIGGWDPFGPERLVTKSRGNILYALDGISALDLYRQYLGEHARGLPATGLLFPLAIRLPDSRSELVRTILKVDESEHSLIFAGDIPEGAYARMMKANFDRLIDGAADSARHCVASIASRDTQFALLVSCVGRRMVLKQRVEEELESVREILGPGAAMTGFYSYGEISPVNATGRCELHNQTMTVTTLAEVSHG